MKKTILLVILAIALIGAPVLAVNLNVMTKSGEVVTGSLIGADENSLFIKAADGNAKTVKLSNVNKIFDADTMKDITSKYKSSVEAKSEPAHKAAAKADEGAGIEYETVEDSSGTINLAGEGGNFFSRTTGRYFDLGISIFQCDVLFGDNKRIKQLLKPFKVDAGGYSYDDGSMMFSVGWNAYAYVRPIDAIAIGGFYGLNPMNQNVNVYRGSDKFMYIDLPVSRYGLLVKLIPYSEARAVSSGELEDTWGWSIDFKYGAASLGTPFSAASINDEATVGDAVDLASSAPYLAVEFTIWSQPDIFFFGIGYQQSVFEGLKVSKPYAGIATDTDGYLADGNGKIPFNYQGAYLYLTLGF